MTCVIMKLNFVADMNTNTGGQLKLENQEVEANDDSANVPQSRAERRSRKLMQGVGLKKIEGIQRVTLKRPRGVSSTLSWIVSLTFF